ncbi:hypothetical protein OROMI_008883 [Orobanche minor]
MHRGLRLSSVYTRKSGPAITRAHLLPLLHSSEIMSANEEDRKENIGSELEGEFKEYAGKAKELPGTTSSENKLVLYGLYKQATVGSVDTCGIGLQISPAAQEREHSGFELDGMSIFFSSLARAAFSLSSRVLARALEKTRPGGLFNLENKAKWDAWKAVEGKSKEDAMREYIIKVKQLRGEPSI